MTENLPDKSGIYCIYFEQYPDAYYIGCSVNIAKRAVDHKSALNTGKHANYKLQNLYNKYGSPNIELLELCPIEDMYDKEILYIKEFNAHIDGYNLTMGGEGRTFGENNGFAKYSKEVYVTIFKELALTDKSYQEISEELSVSKNVVKTIGSLKSHGYLGQEYPELYTLIKNKLGFRDNSAKYLGKSYPKLISPNGIIYTVDNIHKFASEHGLQYQNLHKVLTGQRAVHLGWKICK